MPKYIPLVIKDLVRFRRTRKQRHSVAKRDTKSNKGYMKLKFSNKEIQIIYRPA